MPFFDQSNMMPLVSVIILNYDGAPHLPECLASLKTQTYPNVEIIVADNGSTDNSADVCASFEGVQFAALGANYGFGLGNNLGAQRARGEYLFFVNNDMRFASDLIEKLVEVAQEHTEFFALDPKVYNWNGDQVLHSATFLCPAEHRSGNFLPGISVVRKEVEEVTPVAFAGGANIFCVAEKFRALGGFDPTFFWCWEDTDLCWRAWLRGWPTLYVPQAVCWHKVGGSSSEPPAHLFQFGDFHSKTFYFVHRDRFRFIAKTMGFHHNLGVFWQFVRSVAGLGMQGRWIELILMIAAYLDGVGRLWDVARARSQIRRMRRLSNEELFGLFWCE